MIGTSTGTSTAPHVGAITAPTCGTCGATAAPDGTCLEIGTCPDADTAATRSATRDTAKSRRAPAAWTASGRVD